MTLTDYIWKKEGGRGLISIKDSVDASIQRLKDNIEKRRGRLITASRNNTDNMRINRNTITREKKNGKKNNCMDILSNTQCNIMAEGFRFIYLAFGFNSAENLSAQHMG